MIYRGPDLDWFPKRFGPGDIDGGGTLRLLGMPDLDPGWVLVREMAQNSWDAAGDAPEINFTLNLKCLSGEALEILRNQVFTGNPLITTGGQTPTSLVQLLKRREVWALEVSDRGTVGLDGPVRNDLAVDSSISTNFIDLVLNIGAPRDIHLGGGTYGFGKTIAYVISSVGTVLFWSRCKTIEGLQHRLIGSAIGESFEADGARFTGRHWWGKAIDHEDRVEPVVGDAAQQIGESVFSTHFPGDSTGTSILILDPQLDGETYGNEAGNLAAAVFFNLWPKLLRDQGGRATRMNVSVEFDGEPISLPTVEDDAVLSGYAACLRALRAEQSGADWSHVSSRHMITMREVWCERPHKLLGHLALTRYPVPRGSQREPSHSVTLMRHQAELVVRNREFRSLDVDGFQWAGVFKPVEDVDDSFADAEPPAHDDWVPKFVRNKERRRDVNVALTRIKEIVGEFLAPPKPSSPNQESPVSAVTVGDLLADLIIGLPGPAPTSRRPGLRRKTEAAGRPLGKGQSGQEDTTPGQWRTEPEEGTGTQGGLLPQGNGMSSQGTMSESSAAGGGDKVPLRDPVGGRTGASQEREDWPPPTPPMPNPGVAPGRRKGVRPRADIVGESYESAADDGWTRARLDVKLAEESWGNARVDVPVWVGVDGGSVSDTDAIRIIGWETGLDDGHDPKLNEFRPGDIRRFVFEVRADLAVDVDVKVGDA